MLRMLIAALKSVWEALCWSFCFAWEVATIPLRAVLPKPGRAAIPSAPARAETNPSTTFRPDVSPKALAHREAAAVIGWLSKRLRQGSGCPAPSTIISPSVRNWAHLLDDDQARRAIALGFTRLSEHLAGRKLEVGLPVHGAITAKADSDDLNRLRPAAQLIRSRNRIAENYAMPRSAHR